MKKVMVGVSILALLTIISVVYAQNHGMMGSQGMMGANRGKATQNPPQLSDGAKIYNANCRVCHVNGGNVIYPNLPLKGSLKLQNFDSFLTFIRNPKMPDGSQGAMPSFSRTQISDERAKTLYEYITSEEGLELESEAPEGAYCPRYGQCPRPGRGYHMGPGMMGSGYGMGPGMMWGGQQGWNYCPYCGQPLRQGGYGMMGPGYGSYGMGPGMMWGRHGMMGGYGMGPGMMRGYGGYSMRPGIMEPGYYQQNEACQRFLDENAGLRKELNNKRFEYFEAIRNPKTTAESATKLQQEFRELQEKIYSEAPQGCWGQ